MKCNVESRVMVKHHIWLLQSPNICTVPLTILQFKALIASKTISPFFMLRTSSRVCKLYAVLPQDEKSSVLYSQVRAFILDCGSTATLKLRVSYEHPW